MMDWNKDKKKYELGYKMNKIDIEKAREAFNEYLNEFDATNDKIRLKIVHTENVVKSAKEIAFRMGLSVEDSELAELIALLHDIGRFEQLRQFNSFEETAMMEHAAYGVQLLFGERHMIRRFISDESFDDIIYTAIARHSDYAIGDIKDERTLMHAKLIRDADKLDNCRVKLEDSMETIIDIDEISLGEQFISDKIWESCLKRKPIVSAQRVTKMDYWVSYVGYFFDINFPETFTIINAEHYVERIIDRVNYRNPDTANKMAQLKQIVLDYMEEKLKACS